MCHSNRSDRAGGLVVARGGDEAGLMTAYGDGRAVSFADAHPVVNAPYGLGRIYGKPALPRLHA
jgi:hypothetical protein